jgi:uncharacterized protein YkwD
MRVKTLSATILSAIVSFLVVAAPSAHAATYSTSSYGSRLLQLVNQARSSNGLHTLTLTSGTSTVAAGWTQHLANQGALSHNPNLASQLESHGSPNWTIYGENVGQGAPTNPDQLFNAYMQSPEHRANILEARYRYVGVAVVFAGGYAWNTFDFVDQYGGSTATTTTTKTTTKPATHVTTTTTTPTRHVAVPTQKRSTVAPHKAVVIKRAAVHHATATVPQVEAVHSEQPAPAAADTMTQPQTSHTAIVTNGSNLAKSAARLAAALAIVLLVGGILTAARRRPRVPAFA